MTRLYVELHSQLSLTEVTFDSWRWASFISKTRWLAFKFIGSVYWDLVLVNRNANSLFSKWRNANVHLRRLYFIRYRVQSNFGADNMRGRSSWRSRWIRKDFQYQDAERTKDNIFHPQFHCDFRKGGSTLMLSNMVGGRGDGASIYIFKFSWKKWCMLLLLLDWQYPECVFSFWNSICFPWLFVFSLSTDEIEAIWDKARYFGPDGTEFRALSDNW